MSLVASVEQAETIPSPECGRSGDSCTTEPTVGSVQEGSTEDDASACVTSADSLASPKPQEEIEGNEEKEETGGGSGGCGGRGGDCDAVDSPTSPISPTSPSSPRPTEVPEGSRPVRSELLDATNARVISGPSKTHDVLRFFACNSTGSEPRFSCTTVSEVSALCEELLGKDYVCGRVSNADGRLCPSYPPALFVLESSVHGGPRVNATEQLEPLFEAACSSRVHGRFAFPVIMCRGKNVCRSGTISNQLEHVANHVAAKARQLLSTLVSVPSNPQSTSFSLDQQRRQDVQLLRGLRVGSILDLMVEERKRKYGMHLCSSEKVDHEGRYADFDLFVTPFPGCEFFNDFRANGHNGVGLCFDWSQPCNDAVFAVPAFYRDVTGHDWSKVRTWDLVTLTQRYVQLCIAVLADPEAKRGLLVHCISGWDRTPMLVSILRILTWAEGESHASLSAEELLYLTVGYDWFLFGHHLEDRGNRGEDIFYFAFYMLRFLEGPEFSLRYWTQATARARARENAMRDGQQGSEATAASAATSAATETPSPAAAPTEPRHTSTGFHVAQSDAAAVADGETSTSSATSSSSSSASSSSSSSTSAAPPAKSALAMQMALGDAMSSPILEGEEAPASSPSSSLPEPSTGTAGGLLAPPTPTRPGADGTGGNDAADSDDDSGAQVNNEDHDGNVPPTWSRRRRLSSYVEVDDIAEMAALGERHVKPESATAVSQSSAVVTTAASVSTSASASASASSTSTSTRTSPMPMPCNSQKQQQQNLQHSHNLSNDSDLDATGATETASSWEDVNVTATPPPPRHTAAAGGTINAIAGAENEETEEAAAQYAASVNAQRAARIRNIRESFLSMYPSAVASCFPAHPTMAPSNDPVGGEDAALGSALGKKKHKKTPANRSVEAPMAERSDSGASLTAGISSVLSWLPTPFSSSSSSSSASSTTATAATAPPQTATN